jgi:hypothetical protein
MRNMKAAYKLFLLREKYGESSFNKKISISNGHVYLNGLNVDKTLGYSVLPGIGIDRMKHLGEGRIQIEGHISGLLSVKSQYWAETSRGKFTIQKDQRRLVNSRNIFLGEQVDINEAFIAVVNTLDKDEIKFLSSTGFGDDVVLSLKMGQFAGLGNMRLAYSRFGKILMRKHDKSLEISP